MYGVGVRSKKLGRENKEKTTSGYVDHYSDRVGGDDLCIGKNCGNL